MTKYTVDFLNSSKIEDSRLTVISLFQKEYPNRKKALMAKCICVCGSYTEVIVVNLKSTRSCGCYRMSADVRVIGVENFKRYNKSLMQTYYNMIARCHNEKSQYYPNYGGKGVVVCDEWRKDFNSFIKWCLENGWNQGLQLDKDIKGNGLIYSPSTCCFVTSKENNNNKINNVRRMYKGESLTLKQISEKEGISDRTLYDRISNGWSIEEAIVPTPLYAWKILINSIIEINLPEMQSDEYRSKMEKAKNILHQIASL